MRALIAAFLIIATTPGWAAEASITDGATLIVDGVTYRLDGIDAPQTDQTCLNDKGAAWACGIEARDRLREHIGKRDVRCTDKGADSTYRKRRVGECSVVGEPISINQWMVQEGWALNFDRSAKGRFKADRDSASDKRIGLWKGCFVSPEALRRFTISTASLLGSACPKTNNWKVRETLFPEYPAQPPDCASKDGSICAPRYRAISASIIRQQAAEVMHGQSNHTAGSVRKRKLKPRASVSRIRVEGGDLNGQ